jgi:hypothetical protein
MMSYSPNGLDPNSSNQGLPEDGGRVFCRGWRLGDEGNPSAALVVLPTAEHPSPASLDRLVHEYGLKKELDGERSSNSPPQRRSQCWYSTIPGGAAAGARAVARRTDGAGSALGAGPAMGR